MASLVVVLLMVLQFITTFEMSMVMPLAPVIALHFGAVASTVPYLNIGYSISGFLSPLFGFLADKFGQKRMMLISVLIFSVGCLIVAQGMKVHYLIGRFILGVGYFNLTSIIMAYTSKLITTEKLGLVSGLYKIAFALGAFSSPLIGSKIASKMPFTNVYYMISIIAFVIFVLMLFIPDVNTSTEDSLSISSAFAIFKDKKAQYMIFANFLLSIPAVYFYNYASIYMSDIQILQVDISKYYSIVAFGSICAGLLISIIGDKFGIEKLSVLSGILTSITLLIVFKNPLSLVVGFIFGLFYDTIWGVFYPSGSKFYLQKSATFLTILSFTTSATNLFSNVTAPILYSVGSYSLLIIISALGLLIASMMMLKAFKLNKLDNK